jgi:hypothetical protein
MDVAAQVDGGEMCSKQRADLPAQEQDAAEDCGRPGEGLDRGDDGGGEVHSAIGYGSRRPPGYTYFDVLHPRDRASYRSNATIAATSCAGIPPSPIAECSREPSPMSVSCSRGISNGSVIGPRLKAIRRCS